MSGGASAIAHVVRAQLLRSRGCRCPWSNRASASYWRKFDSNYALVAGASKRARQSTTTAALAAASSDETPPMVASDSTHELSVAFEEIAQGKLLVREPQRGGKGSRRDSKVSA